MSRLTRSSSKLRDIPEDDDKTEVIAEEENGKHEKPQVEEPPLKNPRGTQSQVARTFQNGRLPVGELVQGLIPGLGEVAIKHLRSNGIGTVNQLVACFFNHERDEVEFIEILEAMGVRNQDARVVAYNFVIKMGNW